MEQLEALIFGDLFGNKKRLARNAFIASWIQSCRSAHFVAGIAEAADQQPFQRIALELYRWPTSSDASSIHSFTFVRLSMRFFTTRLVIPRPFLADTIAQFRHS